MAKMKTFAVEVEITRRVTLFVQARRPNGAIDQVMSEDGWREATAYHNDIDSGDRTRAKALSARVMQ